MIGEIRTDPGSLDTHAYAWIVTHDGQAFDSGSASVFTFPPVGHGTYEVFMDDDVAMTSVAFILGVLPLVIAEGAEAEMRRTLGTAVFFGMLGVTVLGIFLTPVFFAVIRRWATPDEYAIQW